MQIDETFQQHLTNLQTLHLSHNRLGDNTVSVTNAVSLRFLDLSHNSLTQFQVPRTLSALEHLLLAGNQIRNITSMSGLHNLCSFDISRNRLTSIPGFLLLDSKKILHTNFSSNLISKIDHQAFRPQSPDVIDLSRNKLVKLWNSGWKTAKTIDLHGNRITEMDDQSFYAMYELQELDLSRNNLSQLNPAVFVFLSDLEVLDLRDNHLTSDVELYNTMHSLQQITSIDLSHNQLRYIMEGTFDACRNLRRITMSHNPIHILRSSTMAGLHSLQEVDFSYSSFLCGCELVSFQEWMMETKVKIIHQSNSSYQCKSPPHRVGLDVRSYRMSEFECNETLFFVTVFASIGAGVMVIGVIAALIYYYCCRGRKTSTDELIKPIMNGNVPSKEERKKRGIPIEVLKNAHPSEVEKLLKAEYRRKREPEAVKNPKTKKDSKKIKSRQSSKENRVTRDMIRHPGLKQELMRLPQIQENRYMDRREYYRTLPSRPIYNPYMYDRSRSQADLYPSYQESRNHGYRERQRNPYYTARYVDIIRRPQPRYSQSVPDMLNRVHTLPKPHPPREPHFISRNERKNDSSYDVRLFKDPNFRPWVDQERCEDRREFIPPEPPRDYPTVHSGYYTISAKTADKGSGNRTQWI